MAELCRPAFGVQRGIAAFHFFLARPARIVDSQVEENKRGDSSPYSKLEISRASEDASGH
jgi:hypothetical protein